MAHHGRWPVAVAAVALLVAMVAGPLLPKPAKPLTGTDAADAFLAAYRRSRLGTYAVDSSFTRRLADGRTLRSSTAVAQRPPDRIVTGLGTVAGRLAGRELDCATNVDGSFKCFPGAAVQPYAREVASEMERLTPYVSGPRPLYQVVGDGSGCFTLRLAVAVPAPPYGDAAQFCFDPRTGAVVYLEIRRKDNTDITRAQEVRAHVTDDDLVVPSDAGGLPQPGG